MQSNIHLEWNAAPVKNFHTGISLHSHTLHSKESLGFIYHAAAKSPLLTSVIRRGEREYRKRRGGQLDLNRGWWTPPLAPHGAWDVEKKQIETLDLNAMVSLTDHDDIEAPVSLQILPECREVPISVEWTVPFQSTFFHIGVHNLPGVQARAIFSEMNALTLQPTESRMRELLAWLAAMPGVLVIFNHPVWDEKGIGREAHREAVQEFLRQTADAIHAMELNGLRPWSENQETIALAEALRKPLISGGDRHGLEPNAMLNLSNASGFAEFAEEVRSGWSDVLIMRHYRESNAWRIVHNMVDILSTLERHPKGWRLWSDRVFFRAEDGNVQSLTEWFGERTPAAVTIFVGVIQLASAPRVRRFLRGTFAEGEKVAL